MSQGKLPSIWISCVPLVILVALIACVVNLFGDDTLNGASQVALLVATAFCISIGLASRKITWADFEAAIAEKIAGISQALLVLLLIGALGGAWMVSGIVPTLIYYGMEIMNPQWFLVSSCFICAIVSVMTGSSWTTIATIGVALMGIGQALGFSEAWIAGAIISGAYFGDKISPLSDTTILASSNVGTPLSTHIRYMMYTTIPSFLITLMIFTGEGIENTATSTNQVSIIQEALDNTFLLSPYLLIVPLITCLLIALRMPSTAVLFLATLMGVIVAVFVQGDLMDQIAGSEVEGIAQRFKGAVILVYGSTELDTGVPELNDLVATRGMHGMLATIWLILCATLFGAAMTATRMIDSIMQALLHLVRGTVSLVASTAWTGVMLNIITADQYMSIILTGTMFKDTYQRNGYEARLLSRTCEDSTTVTSVLIPWNTCGMTQSTVLGVSTFLYAPYCFFCYLSPIVTVIVAAIGRNIHRVKPVSA